ncbi:MAG: hypothetical protein HYR55_18980 [Acidobacteria bacterium]|nr:hypothetical protein [Acidobacteriota bacterium]MBI3657457.1 hypothetical protein [Acidobacteriota bacterium]
MVDFDEKIVSPANGFSSAFDYYEKMSVYPRPHELHDHVRSKSRCSAVGKVDGSRTWALVCQDKK